jgi:hypothetical protein
MSGRYRTRNQVRSICPVSYDHWVNGYSEQFMKDSLSLQRLPPGLDPDARLLLSVSYQMHVDHYRPFFEARHTEISQKTLSML